MSLFKKRKNLNIRQRRFSDDDGDAEGKDASATSNEDSNSNITLPQKKEKKKSKEKCEGKKVSSVLSFGDDLEADDGIVFHERKSSLSYKLRKEMKKERKEKKRGEKEKMRPDKDGDAEKGTGVTELDELGIRIINGREAEMLSKQGDDIEIEGGEEEDGSHLHVFKPRPKKEPQTLDPWKKILQSGQIPDANMIHAIIKQRQKAREQGSGFIPLDDTVRVEESKGRLIREDDNDHSDDGEGRMDLSVNQQARDRKEREEAFNAAQGNASGESDHEGEWEKQQLLKAGATAKLMEGDSEASQDQDSASQLLGSSTLPNLWGSDSLLPSSSAALPRPANYQAEGIIKRLQDR